MFAALSVSLVAVLIFGGLYVQAGRRIRTLTAQLWTARAHARDALVLRENLLEAGQEAVAVWSAGESKPVSFGNAQGLIGECLGGPDGAAAATALAALRENGTPFTILAVTPALRRIALRGIVVGGHTAVFLHRVVMRDFSAGNPSQRELPPSILERRAAPGVSGAAGGAIPTDAYAQTLDQMGTGVAIFDGERRLLFSNASLAAILRLDPELLRRHPKQSEILDCLRENRQLPEQIDFAAWKREREELFGASGSPRSEHWHLPDGRGLRLTRRPIGSGGMAVFIDDVTESLRLEAANSALLKVQQATLDTLQEGCAVFGPDGRLRGHNTAFARLWRLSEGDLSDCPHIKRIGEACVRRTGHDGIWDILISEVTSASSERHKDWFRLERLDGRILSLSLTRLPDGSALALFSDITDFCRFEPALREKAAVA